MLWMHLENKKHADRFESANYLCETGNDKIQIVFGVNIGHRLFLYTDNLSKTLQTEKMSTWESKRNALLVISVLQSMRNEALFNNFYVIVVNTKTHDLIKDPVAMSKNNAPKYSLLHSLGGHKSNELAFCPATALHRYWGIFNEASKMYVFGGTQSLYNLHQSQVQPA